jgi:hypothetical protein
MKEVPDDLGEHPKRAEHPNQRRLSPHLEQIDVEQRLPGRRPVGRRDGRNRAETS